PCLGDGLSLRPLLGGPDGLPLRERRVADGRTADGGPARREQEALEGTPCDPALPSHHRRPASEVTSRASSSTLGPATTSSAGRSIPNASSTRRLSSVARIESKPCQASGRLRCSSPGDRPSSSVTVASRKATGSAGATGPAE